MAYISREQVAAIRAQLKAKFPKHKFSVRKGSGSYSVTVSILSGPDDFKSLFGKDHFDVNHYHLYQYGDFAPLFEEIISVIKGQGWYDNSDSQYDYFDTAYYVNLEVGKWNKGYTKVT